METKASYVIVGAFSVLVILAGLGFFLWLAKVQINKTYTQYDIIFDSASGLNQSSPVTFNGVNVGKVLTITLDRADPSRVRIRIEVSATTPVRIGTQATLASQGVTGVAFVSLNGGDAGADRLPLDALTGVAVIPSKPSPVQNLLNTAPDLLNKAVSVLNDAGRFTTQENADHVSHFLTNLDDASGRLNQVVDDLSKATASIAKASDNVAAFSDKLNNVATTADGTLNDARTTLANVNDFATNANGALKDIRTTMGHVDNFTGKGLPQLATQAAKLLSDLTSLTARIERDPARFFLGNRTPEYSR